jgi:(E)-4-hydroxy-3-methylbut-2-enyl-diphosphate synthase
MRRKTRQVLVGPVAVGGGSPVTVQTMTKSDTRDAAATLRQVRAAARAGCDIVRVAVPDAEAAAALGAIVKGSPLPVVADIHFDYRLALASLEAGVHALRINPGNIGSRAKVERVVEAARDRGVPIRIGVNAGSLEKDLLRRHGWPTAEALVESALGHAAILEDLRFPDIKISVKASDIPTTVKAYRLLAKKTDYPLHLGVTEAGTRFAGTVKSAIGIGMLLFEGIGDTLRVSLTGSPEAEVRAGREILRSLGMLPGGAVVVSCPTCGRTRVPILPVVEAVEKAVRKRGWDVHVAVMGCEVNGPGEARLAEIGLAFGNGRALVFRGGKPHKVLGLGNVVADFLAEIEAYMGEKAARP